MRLAEEGFPDAGPSPLSRGIPAPPPGSPTPTRIIPALAGNTPSPAPHATTGPDHPRSRGEYWPSITTVAIVSGSSPHSRGIREATPPGEAPSGIIPALAGNTGQRRRPRWRGGDHPRSRGEYSRRPEPSLAGWGSSPLSRGILKCAILKTSRSGIIPALAGNTKEKQMSKITLDGSSPLSRGIRRSTGECCFSLRIIPALAGNTGRPFQRP